MLESVYFIILLLKILMASTNLAQFAPQSAPEIWYWIIPSNTYVHKASYFPKVLAMFYKASFSICRREIQMNPVKYGYKFDEGENLLPTVMMELSTPVGLSIPCNYSKYSRPGVC